VYWLLNEQHRSLLAFVIAKAESLWRSTVSQKPYRIAGTRSLHAVDYRIGHFCSLLAMTSE
jgi:hypothetical protein